MPFNAIQYNQSFCSKKPCYTLIWRQKKLIIFSGKSTTHKRRIFAQIEEDRNHIRQCLRQSSSILVLLDTSLETTELSLWASLCKEAGKPAYLREKISSDKTNTLLYCFKRIGEPLSAAIAILLLSPLALIVILFLLKIDPKLPLFCREWHIGKKGKIYEKLSFRWPSSKKLRWIKRSNIEELPSLINVVKGDSSLFKPNTRLSERTREKSQWKTIKEDNLLLSLGKN